MNEILKSPEMNALERAAFSDAQDLLGLRGEQEWHNLKRAIHDKKGMIVFAVHQLSLLDRPSPNNEREGARHQVIERIENVLRLFISKENLSRHPVFILESAETEDRTRHFLGGTVTAANQVYFIPTEWKGPEPVFEDENTDVGAWERLRRIFKVLGVGTVIISGIYSHACVRVAGEELQQGGFIVTRSKFVFPRVGGRDVSRTTLTDDAYELQYGEKRRRAR